LTYDKKDTTIDFKYVIPLMPLFQQHVFLLHVIVTEIRLGTCLTYLLHLMLFEGRLARCCIFSLHCMVIEGKALFCVQHEIFYIVAHLWQDIQVSTLFIIELYYVLICPQLKKVFMYVEYVKIM
jgi:hypothetical protein